MLINATEEGKPHWNPPLKISRNTNFEKTCKMFCCYLQHYATTVSWLFYVNEPMNPNKFLLSRGIFLFERRLMYSSESEI